MHQNDYQERAQTYPAEQQQNQRQQLVERYRQRQDGQKHSVPVPTHPQHEAADVRLWWGGRRESLALQRHHHRMDAIYYNARQAAYTQDAVLALALEYYTFVQSTRTIAAQERELLTTDPQSLAYEIAEQLLFDSAERIRVASTEIHEQLRKQSLGS